MSPVIVQGLFHAFYMFVFFGISFKLLQHARQSGNQISRYLGLSLGSACLEYVFMATAILFFSQNPLAVKILSGVFGILFTLVSVGFGTVVFSFFVPKMPVKLLLAVLAVVGTLMIGTNIAAYEPLGITPIGLVDLTLPYGQIIVISLLLMATFVPISAGFIYKTFKSKMYLRGILLGLGLMSTVIFLPLSYQVTVYSGYVFFSLMSSTGFLLLLTGVWMHPSLKQTNNSAPLPVQA